ncbi:uncharacterized protein LOC130994699 isoform X1 [Salvia miltiorrhiza]|uniref:uncharacterized protein LOC130994699 isoform X1 n=1 Tax=Salvia miltiorrhiza TaxID=226208 RepID=UPI0025AD87FB|nr:uncharacterized protein LOC130994699 isoform X1 [Salvia miltiorrhiza]
MAVAASTPSISSRTVIDCRHCRCPLFFSVLDRLEAKEPPPPFATFIPPPTLPADLPLPPPENQKSLYHLPSPTCTTNRIFFASFQLQLQVSDLLESRLNCLTLWCYCQFEKSVYRSYMTIAPEFMLVHSINYEIDDLCFIG